jgi:hypothetical protein
MSELFMAVRFTPYFVGNNFILRRPISFISSIKKQRIKLKKMKAKKFKIMLEDLLDDDKIYRTNETLVPNFLRTAINDLIRTKKIMSN